MEKLWPRKHIKKQRHYFANKGHIVKAMCGCESWTIKKAKCQGTDAFELWCCRRLLRIPWTARRSSQSNLKEINPEYSLEGLVLKLKLQTFGPLIRTDSLEKTLLLGKIEGWRRRGQQRNKMVGWHHQLSPTQWTWVWVSSGRWWRTGKPGVLQSMGSAKSWTQLSNNNKYQDRKCVMENYQSKQIWTELPS